MLISSVLNYKLLFYKNAYVYHLIMWVCMSMCTCVQGLQRSEEGSSPTGADLQAVVKL